MAQTEKEIEDRVENRKDHQKFAVAPSGYDEKNRYRWPWRYSRKKSHTGNGKGPDQSFGAQRRQPNSRSKKIGVAISAKRSSVDIFLRLASKQERSVSLLVGLGSGTYKFNLSKREVRGHDNYSHHSCFIAHRGNPSLALQPQLGAVSQWRHWVDPSDFDHPIAASSGIATAQSQLSSEL